MVLIWRKDSRGYWSADYRGSTLSAIQQAGVWHWQAAVNDDLIRHGVEVSYHLAKAAAMSAAGAIAEEGSD